jgi:hypothetical protein
MQKTLCTGTYFLQMNVTLSWDPRKTLARTDTTFCSCEILQAPVIDLSIVKKDFHFNF